MVSIIIIFYVMLWVRGHHDAIAGNVISRRNPTDWDYNWSTEGQLRFNATTASKDGTPTATPRVAELSVFAPSTFEHLRGPVFGISEAEYRQSMFGAGPFVSFQSNSKGAARVGGVFFFTRDGAYMIKTIKVRNSLSNILARRCLNLEVSPLLP
jgi:hypothetical protein